MHKRVTVLLLAALLAACATVALSYPPVAAQACTELVVNGGFETTDAWQLGVSPIPPQYVTYTAHSGTHSLQLGITSGANVESFSSARQTVTIPPGTGPVTLSFWYYALADSPATTDYMELILLTPDGSVILAKPWQSHNDSRIWNQMAFDLSAWRGQTFQVYFNVYNDGVGGRAALFLDDVTLTTCPPVGTPGPTSTATRTGTPSVMPPTATHTATPGCIDLVRNGAFTNGLGDWETLGDPSGVTLATDRFQSAPYSLKLGSLDITLNGLAAARQQVTIPAGASFANLEVSIYNQSQGGAGADYQEIALLNSMGGLLYVPFRGPSNDSAWVRLQFNLAAFAGQTVYLRFAVNNDGMGGRTVMYVDDVRLTTCSPGFIPTAAPTTTRTPAPTITWTPIPTQAADRAPAAPTAEIDNYPTAGAPADQTAPSGCAPLVRNGDFEAGLAGWQAGPNLLPPAVVTAPVHRGGSAVQLGAPQQNLNSYSSIRQTVSVPWGYPRTVISFWAYTWAEMGGAPGGDRQQFVLLGAGNVVWATPWTVLESTQTWQRHVFELVGVGGQTFDIYFAAINDGKGGRTVLVVDDVRLWGCAGNASPFAELDMAEPAEAVSVPEESSPGTVPADVEETGVRTASGAETPDVTAPSAQWTQVAIGQAPGAILVVTGTPPALRQPGAAIAETPTVFMNRTPQATRSQGNNAPSLPQGWQYFPIGLGILLLILLVVAWRQWRQRRTNP